MVDILSIGASGLSAYRKLLETVGGNITNASTDGYVRRDVQMSTTGDAGMLPTSAHSSTGSGVIVDSVRRASDYYLQMQSLNANALNNQMQTLADSLTRLEKTIFVTDNNPGAVVQEFYSRFSDVSGSPTSASARLSVVDSGTRVAQVFSQAAGALGDTLTTIRTGLDAALNQVNSLTGQLSRLNVEIQSATSSGQKPNDLLDQRDKIMASLSNLVGFTYTEQNSGVVTVYLGDSASGRTLIGPDGVHTLGVVETNGRLDVTLDPYTNPAPTNQLNRGTVAGLLNFRTETLHVLENINRLAVGFSTAVNAQHQQGVDQNGDAGKPLFATDGLTAVHGPLNKGAAKLTINISDAAALGDIHYSARYNATTDKWTVTSSDGKSASDPKKITMDGVDFSFDGHAVDGDIFNVDPLLGAAASMRFLIKTPAEIAGALPLYVDPDPHNIGLAEVTPLKRTSQDPTSPVPTASSLFDGGLDTANFISDGAAFMLPPSQTPVTITSLKQLSAVHFDTTASDIAALAKPGPDGTASLSFSIHLDGGTADTLLTFPLSIGGADLNDIASQINKFAQASNQKNALYASVINGALTINALGGHTVDGASFNGFDAVQTPASIKGVNEQGASAAQIRVFTREGRQIFGPALSPSEAASYITTAHGFLSDAVYYPPEQAGYPGATITPGPSLLSVNGGPTSATIDVAALPEFNMAYSSAQAGLDQDGKPLPTASGAVYALNINGLAPVRLAGDALASKTAPDMAQALAKEMNNQASRFSWRGPDVSLFEKQTRTFNFTVTIDGVPHQVSFHRAEDPKTGALLNTGTFDVADDSGVQVSLVPGSPALNGAPANSRVLISIPQTLRSSAPTIGITKADDALTTDFNNVFGATPPQLTTLVTGSGDLTSSLLAARMPTLVVNLVSGQKTLTISGPAGSSAGISWAVIDGKLQLSSNDATMRIDTSTPTTAGLAAALGFPTTGAGKQITATQNINQSLLSAQPMPIQVTDAAGVHDMMIDGLSGTSGGVLWSFNGKNLSLLSPNTLLHVNATDAAKSTNAQALGFNGSDLNLSVLGDRLTLTSNNTSYAGDLVDASATVSRAGSDLSALTFINGVPEDMIVAVVNNDPSGLRRIAANIIPPPVPTSTTPPPPVPPMPDIQIKILDGGRLEILDPASGVSLANRNWEQDKPITYRGLSFTIHGQAVANDNFVIRTDPSRTADNRNALLMAGLASVSIFGAAGGSFQDVYSNVTAKLGTTVNSANMTAAGAAQQASDLKSAYEAKTGVNLDSEASDLIRYQQAYSAAAQVVMAARDMFATILKSF